MSVRSVSLPLPATVFRLKTCRKISQPSDSERKYKSCQLTSLTLSSVYYVPFSKVTKSSLLWRWGWWGRRCLERDCFLLKPSALQAFILWLTLWRAYNPLWKTVNPLLDTKTPFLLRLAISGGPWHHTVTIEYEFDLCFGVWACSWLLLNLMKDAFHQAVPGERLA